MDGDYRVEAILALDQGTTSSRAILFNQHGQIINVAQQEFDQHFPEQGWVEHDPLDIWETQLASARKVFEDTDLTPSDVAGAGITNQRETLVAWDRRSSEPVHNAIVWQDRRTASTCRQMKQDGLEPKIRQKTGLLLDPYFTATKLGWLLENNRRARELGRQGHLAVGTIDTWICWKLTSGRAHVTDPSNASRTLLYNIHTEEWDPELLDLFDVPRKVLPEVQPSSGIVGEIDEKWLGEPIPIAGIAGDQQAALFGQQCWSRGMAKNTYGTGCFLLMNTGTEPVASENRLLTTVAWDYDGRTIYALEGSVFIGGAVVQWLRDGLEIIDDASEIEELADSVNSSDGVYFVPAFTGLGAPHWDPEARGTIAGLTRGSTKAHLARAALEGIAHQSTDVMEAMQLDSGMDLRELRVDGGAARNNLLLQFQADLLDCPVVRPEVLESTAQGAAFLAGLAVDFWADLEELSNHLTEDSRFTRSMLPDDIHDHRQGWKRALQQTKTPDS